MTKKMKLVMITACVLVAGTSVYAAKGDPGSSNDPLVTKSYVDNKIAEVKGTTGSVDTSKLEAQLAVQSQLIDQLTKQVNNLQEKGSSNYEVVSVPAGQSIFGSQGTEIIVRSGSGQVIASSGGGLQDMTEGIDLLTGSNVPRYHLVIVPREDGRGIYATKDLIVMVRGGYNIQ